VNVRPVEPSRRFAVGNVEIAHVADIELDSDEQVTFTAASGSEYDVVRKAWGYYATPSLNRRLPDHGLRPALCRKAQDGRTTILLCERDSEKEFRAYLGEQGMELLDWLDGELCPMCSAPAMSRWHRYEAPPEGETEFDLRGGQYVRELLRCGSCGHFVSRTDLDLSGLYEGDYMDATYAGDRLRTTYDRIMALPPEGSDNVARVRRVVDEVGTTGRLLDVGSGLGVFPARMREAGWEVTALDPDPRAVAHTREVVGVRAVEADFARTGPGDLGTYDLITLNKVLEHVPDPVTMLAQAAALLEPDGVVYVELPDGEGAATEGPGREEFFVEHLHVFSPASLALLVERAGLRLRRVERLREPSTKFTTFAFCDHP
jgi:SAM-dependent methyltransferase